MSIVSQIYRWILKHEPRSVVLIAIVAFGTWGFIELADEVLEGESQVVDQSILLSFRSEQNPADPLGPRWFEEAARDLTSLGSMTLLHLVVLFAAGYFLLSRQRALALFLVFSVGLGTLVSSLLKVGFDRPRPDLVPHAVEVYTQSFPSGHSSMSALVFLTLAALLARAQETRRIKIYLLSISIFLTLLVGMSRVYLGVHWPTDVLAGWMFGTAWAAGSWLVFGLWSKR